MTQSKAGRKIEIVNYTLRLRVSEIKGKFLVQHELIHLAA